MPKAPDVVGGEPIESAYSNNEIRNKTVQRATNAADLAAGWPAPGDGETVWQQDTDELKIWTGTAWAVIATGSRYLPLSGGTMTGVIRGKDGEVGAPGYAFAGKANTGMWFAGTGPQAEVTPTLYFSVNAAEALALNASALWGAVGFKSLSASAHGLAVERGGVVWSFGMFDASSGVIQEDGISRMTFFRGGGMETGAIRSSGGPVGVLRYNETRSLTVTAAGSEQLTDVVNLSGAGIVSAPNCLVTLHGTSNTIRSFRRTYNYHDFSASEITVEAQALESQSSSSGTFSYKIGIVEYTEPN